MHSDVFNLHILCLCFKLNQGYGVLNLRFTKNKKIVYELTEHLFI